MICGLTGWILTFDLSDTVTVTLLLSTSKVRVHEINKSPVIRTKKHFFISLIIISIAFSKIGLYENIHNPSSVLPAHFRV